MARPAPSLALRDRLERDLASPSSMDDVADRVYAAIRRHVDFDFACFATTDPTTGVLTWASKTRDLGVGDVDFAAAEYGPPDVNKFDEIARRDPPVAILSIDTDGDLSRCRRHREFMSPVFGFGDELRACFLGRAATWAALALYRRADDPPFTPADAATIADACPVVAEAVQRTMFRLPPSGGPHAGTDHGGPAVLIVDAGDRVTHMTAGAHAAVEILGGLDHGQLPPGILAVVASTRTSGTPLTTQTLTADGTWLSVRTAPLDGSGDRPDVVVTVEPTSRIALSRMALAAHGLTSREEDVALQVLQGANTRDIAATLHLSPYTVQDHLKTIFAKLGVSSRREMTARLVLDA
ncbi:MAG: LuxR C-terminal-related transcriptional regulator [Gordonia paraffinivorans]